MKKKSSFNKSRRDFLIRTVPACAMTCMMSNSVLATTFESLQEKPHQAKHKFDESFGEFSYRQYSMMQSRFFIEFTKSLQGKLGKENVLEYIREFSDYVLTARGKAQAAQAPDISLQSYVNQFKTNPLYKKALTFDIIEDNDKTFEMRVTECLTYTTFKTADACDIGHACICHGDYAWAVGFNPKIKLIRDKTLMQGHDYCNHRYIIEG